MNSDAVGTSPTSAQCDRAAPVVALRCLAVLLGLTGAVGFVAPPAYGQAIPKAANLLRYTDIGQADILVTAASIRQSGDHQTGSIDQKADVSTTDRGLYPVGQGNIADLVQDGSYNQAYLQQTGNLNRMRVVQDGVNNYVQATQIGVDNRLDLSQTGPENQLISHQEGTGNIITLSQAGGNVANLKEVGDRNEIHIKQVLGGAPVSIELIGSGLKVSIQQ
jgi:hypothetical protein